MYTGIWMLTVCFLTILILLVACNIQAGTSYPTASLGDAVMTIPSGVAMYLNASNPPVVWKVVSSVPDTIALPLDKVVWFSVTGDGNHQFRCIRTAAQDTTYVLVTSLGGGTFVAVAGVQ